MKNDSLDVSLQRGLYVAQDGLHCVRQAFEGGGVKTSRTDASERKGAAIVPAMASAETAKEFAFFVMACIIPNYRPAMSAPVSSLVHFANSAAATAQHFGEPSGSILLFLVLVL